MLKYICPGWQRATALSSLRALCCPLPFTLDPHSSRHPKYLVITGLMPGIWGGVSEPRSSTGPRGHSDWLFLSPASCCIFYFEFWFYGYTHVQLIPKGEVGDMKVITWLSSLRGGDSYGGFSFFVYLFIWLHKDVGSWWFCNEDWTPGKSTLGFWSQLWPQISADPTQLLWAPRIRNLRAITAYPLSLGCYEDSESL